LIAVAGCATSDSSNDTGTGGSSSTGAAGVTGSAGNGSTGSAGSATAGTNGTAGNSGAAGNNSTGSAGSTATAGTGGATSTGTAGASGATGSAGRGGTTGNAGRGGTTGAAGQGGAVGSGGSGGATGGARGGTGGASGAAGASGTAGSSGGLFTINVQLASAMKSTAPTTVGIVTWSTTATGVTAAHIDFGADTTYGMTAPVDLTAMGYRTLLLGMKPAKTYHFRIVATAGGSTIMSDDQTVMTGAKISAAPLTSFSVKNAAANPKGFYITSFWNGTGSKVPFIFDSDGDVVWWYTAGSGESSDGISRARMSADSQSIWLVNESLTGNPLRRVSIDGLTTQTYSNTKASHDICAVSGDTMAYLDYGEADCNSIFEINNAGTTKEVFEATNMTSTGTGMQNCHGNAVRYSKKEDQYTYSDWQKELAVISRAGVLQWKLTQKVSGGNTAWGSAQHGHQLLDNSIILFANNGAGMNKSQAIEYGLDGHLIKKFNSNGGATNFGDVQRLANGSTIITYSTSGLMQVVDASDTVVLEVKGTGSFGYVEFRDSLYGPPLDINQ
jgi:hypothetical protein